MTWKIAFVDDEPNVLESLKWVFKDEPYDTYAFQDPFEALEMMDEEEYAVVVADQVMPRIEGINFLKIVKDKCPDTVCIIMTAQPDLKVAVNAINQGNIYRFVHKPWDVMEIKTTIKNAIDLYKLKLESKRLWQLTEKQNEQLLELNQKLKEKVDEQTEEIKQTEDERRELENQLFQAQKMEAIGTLAGGIAHDFNNILTGIVGYTEIASLLAEEDPQIKGAMNKVLEACERAKSLITQVLSISRHKKEGQEAILIGPIIQEVVKLLRASLPPQIEIIENIEGDKKLIKADPTRVHQILMNLCTNSAHAMRERGGTLQIDLVPVEMGSNEAYTLNNLTPGSYLKLSVMDTGHGISQAMIKRIFDPYFTTKEKGEGTGLGLSMVHSIVKNYKGAIVVDSKPGKYTIFNVYFPCLNKD